MLQKYSRICIRIARPDHWPKNVMVLPGAFLAMVVEGKFQWLAFASLAQVLLATCLIASANYTINEYFDREFDKHHPVKKHRALVTMDVPGILVVIQYAVLSICGLLLLYPMNLSVFLAGIVLLGMGLVYNVKPVRTKDVVFLDVLSESVNNPLRLILGWGAVSTIILPPSSLVLAFWFGGAFLMASKRYSEYRFINSPEMAGQYRKSFRHYSELSLLLSSYFYSLLTVFMLTVFLIKYRNEFLVGFPLLALLFTWYLALSHHRDGQEVREPEKVYRNKPFFAFFVFTVLVLMMLFFVDIPFLAFFVEHNVMYDLRLE